LEQFFRFHFVGLQNGFQVINSSILVYQTSWNTYYWYLKSVVYLLLIERQSTFPQIYIYPLCYFFCYSSLIYVIHVFLNVNSSHVSFYNLFECLIKTFFGSYFVTKTPCEINILTKECCLMLDYRKITQMLNLLNLCNTPLVKTQYYDHPHLITWILF